MRNSKLIVKFLKKGIPQLRSYNIVVCKKQSKSSSRLLLLGRLDLAKDNTYQGSFHRLRLDKRRLCKLLVEKKITLGLQLLKYLVPEYLLPKK